MHAKKWHLLAILLVVAMLLGACQPASTPAPKTTGQPAAGGAAQPAKPIGYKLRA